MLFNDTTSKRFWSKVNYAGENGCWLWTGMPTTGGYGTFSFEGNQQYAHRVAYKALIGVIPEDLQIDHLCRVRLCVNPWHLDLVTSRENMRRGESPAALNSRLTSCPQKGHPFDATNTYINPSGKRQCRECMRIRGRARWTHCLNGHPLDEANIYMTGVGTKRLTRRCRQCSLMRRNARVEKERNNAKLS